MSHTPDLFCIAYGQHYLSCKLDVSCIRYLALSRYSCCVIPLSVIPSHRSQVLFVSLPGCHTPLSVLITGNAGPHPLQQQGQFAAHAFNQHQQGGPQVGSVGSISQQPGFGYSQGYSPQLGSTHTGQMGSNDSPHGSAVMQVQAALADSSKLSHLAVPAQQAAGQQHAGPQGLAQSTGAVPSAAQGLHATAASWQHPAGALMPAVSQGGQGSTPAGGDPSTCLHLACQLCMPTLTSRLGQERQQHAHTCSYACVTHSHAMPAPSLSVIGMNT